MPYDPLEWIDGELDELTQRGLLRRLVERSGAQGAEIHCGGRALLNFASNDYLALAADERLTHAAAEAGQTEGWGAGASPLVSGHTTAHARLETRLSEFLGTEAALVFPSGFAANVGTVAALVGRGDAVFGDEKNHASLIDGCRLSRAEVFVYPHRDLATLAASLRAATGFRRRLIVSDTLFSMDGDLAPLAELAELAQQHQAMLLVDEAHATGVLGRQGTGAVELAGVAAGVQVRVGTLSKALGSSGGFVAGSRQLIALLVNRARPYVFSTAHPAAASAAALAALDIVRDEPHRRSALLERSADLRSQLAAQGWNLGQSTSQIIPLVVGTPEQAMRLAAELAAAGIWAPGIRPPSVPVGESLVRLSVSYGHSAAQLEALLAALHRAAKSLG